MRALRLGSLVLSLLLVPAAALANNSADEADVAFELGNEAYARRQYIEALRSYFASYRLVPNRNVLFNIARCYEALTRYNEAYRYYNDLSQQDLSSEDAAEVHRSLERLRPKVALVRVTSEPAGAEVLVDREDLGARGRSPQTLALPPGSHKVMVRKEGYRPAEESIQLVRGSSMVQEFKLELITGEVKLAGTPEGAEVSETPEGPVLGRVPSTLRFIPGRHVLYVRAPGHIASQVLVDVPADTSVPLEVTLRPQEQPTGRIIVTANRDNASVRVDGHPAGFTPTVLTLTEGEHTLEVESKDVRPIIQQVTVVAAQETKFHAELRYEPPQVRAASKNLLSVDEAPASITVITQEELRAFGYTTLADALAGVRGFFISNDRSYTYLGVRGFAPPGDLNTRILILWDGHSMNDVWAGQGYSARDLSVDLGEVDRIEVVRGPGSALYGTGAFFAVINVVPRDSLGPGRRVETTAAVESLGTTRLRGTAAWDEGRNSVLLSVAGVNTQGAETTRMGDGLPVVDGMDGERAASISLRARSGGLSLQASFHAREKQVPTGPFGTVLGAEGTRVEDLRGFAELRYEKTLDERLSLSLRGAYDASRYRGYWMYSQPGGGLRRDTDSGRADWLSVEARFLFNFTPTHRLTVGLEGQGQLRVDQESLGPEGMRPLNSERRTLFSAYLLDEWRPHPRLSLSAGLRLDKYFDLPIAPITPRLALIGRPYDQGLTKLVAGFAFRAPNVYELDYNDNGLTQVAARRLEPESISTLELEHSHNLTDDLRLTVAGYHNRISNLVVLETQSGPPRCGSVPGTVQCITFANRPGETLAWGAEAGVHWQPGRYLLVDLSYSFVTLRNAAEDVAAATPAHLASGRLMLPLGNGEVRLATQATYQSARGSAKEGPRNGEALLISVGLSGEFLNLRYFAGVQNLLDTQYFLPLGEERAAAPVPQYGRTFSLQLTGSF
ncbi:TonB-dependent receptor domain-containing protein [Vitiosangium sp. GDMCC 1.1324]|uniref:TonB-dependent receptor domain-containing protein n=1 Tax=Vitiosangium sp. (strain GDMCC 1.1324) TaxID=2138576 RepID=UPI000D3B2C00|nr:TonB-dependent receptor [Vitiosangium sp. GDMCC 1.1324]PTL80061.1 ligand-gated channel protein [Vitiosangium sp. GDMCC 1.1324]